VKHRGTEAHIMLWGCFSFEGTGRLYKIEGQRTELVCFLMLTLDQMGTRINDLERNVTELMTQAGMEALIKQQHGAFIKALLITS
uniref:Uncharacterized protein n=1 Tax=Haplochromis burtoni TaxID=8153 RepID=A0A3Q2X099_HAPBU